MTNSTSARYFLDTNVLVYTFDEREPRKRARALELLEAALGGAGIISYQVVQEFLNVATRRFARPLGVSEAVVYLDQVLLPLCEVPSSAALFRAAIAVSDRYRFSFYDSLIVAAAQSARCRILYSEDLQHGQLLDELEIVNPFL